MKKRKLIIYITVSLIFLIAIVLGTIYYARNKSSIQRQTSVTLRLGISKSFLSIPIYIAKNEGFFAKEGLNVKIKEYSSGKLATNGMFNGENDISTVADMPVVVNSFKRNDFCIIATFTYSYNMVKIVTRRDSGIKSVEDLKGKKVGINPGTSSHFYLASFLLYNKVPISDLKLINIKTVDMPKALLNKKVDAASVWEPYAQKTIDLLNDNAVVLKAPDIYRTTFSFTAKKKYINEHEEEIIKFLRAIDDAVDFIHKNREQSVEIISTDFNIDKKIVSNLWDTYMFGLFLDESLLINWDSIARWEIKNKFVKKERIPNYLNYVCLDLLKKLKSEAVTIIH